MSANTVQGGKVWTPPPPANQSASPTPATNAAKKKFDADFWLMSVFFPFALVFLIIFIPSPVDVTDGMSQFDWAELTEDGSFRTGILLVTALVATPLVAIIAVATLPTKKAKKILLGIAIFCIANAFVVDGYQKGVVEVNKEEIVSSWFAEEYNYQFIDIIGNESLGNSGDEEFALVIDMETGEEKTVKYYENNDTVYFAVDDAEFIEQVKKNALDKD